MKKKVELIVTPVIKALTTEKFPIYDNNTIDINNFCNEEYFFQSIH